MKRRIGWTRFAWIAWGAALLAWGIPGAALAAERALEYRAEQVVIGPKGKVEKENLLWVSGDRLRLENVKPEKNRLIYIFRRDLHQTVTANVAKKIAFEGAFEEAAFRMALGLPDGRIVAERPMGDEAVAGVSCRKKEIDVEVSFKKGSKTLTYTVWEAERYALPLRVKIPAGRVFELRNLHEEKLDPARFATPKDFKRAATLSEVLPGDPFLDDED